MRRNLHMPSEVKLALLIIGAIVLYALYRAGGAALALASNAIAAIAGWMGRGLADRLGGPPESGAMPPARPGPPAAPEP